MMRSLLVTLLGLLAAVPAVGQAGEVWVAGRLVDAGTGTGVAGAEVRLRGSASVAGVSGREGGWRLGPVPAGRYELTVAHLGYATVERDVEVEGRAAPLEVELTPRPVTLDAMVVTAGRRLQRLAETPVATELVTSREMRETGATDLASVLTERTGIALEGGHPAGSGVMIQGLGSERVLILMDGQPFIGRIAGKVDVSRIPTSMIDRVEVVKGPQSTLYGSEAMGGVVNVITRQPDRSTWSVGGSATAGDQGRLDLAASAIGGAGPVTGLADLGRRSVELAPGRPGASGSLSERWDGLAKLTWHSPLESLRVEGSALVLDERQRWRSGQLFHFADNRQWSGRIGAVWEAGAHRLSPTAYVTRFEHLARMATGEQPIADTGERETQRLAKAELLYTLDLGAVALDAGLESEHEAITSDRVTGAARDHTTTEAYVQATVGGERLSLVPGLRATWSDIWGTHWTPRLAAMVSLAPAVTLRVSAGSGFRAPAFKELYMEFMNIGPGFGYTVRGNTDLRPERSRNLTASVEWTGDRSFLRVQGFDNRFQDFIETRPAGDSSDITVYTYGNVEDGLTRGVEVESGVNWGGWRAEAGASLLEAEDQSSGASLLGRPAVSGRASVGYARPSGLRASLTGIYTGRTPMRRTEAGTDWRDAFVRFDLRIAQDLPGGLELTFGVDNLLDEQSPEWPGFTGRHIYTGISWRTAGARTDTNTN